MTIEFYGPSISDEHLEGLHDFLTTRAWEASRYISDVDDGGYPQDPETTWHYPGSFGSVAFLQHDEITPSFLSCHFRFEHGLSIIVYSAGNIRGCTEHNMTEYEIDLVDGRLDLNSVAALLDELEPAARALDPRALIECRFFGTCGTG